MRDLSLLCFATVAVGCATPGPVPVTQDRLVAAESAISAATALGGENIPQAKLALQNARENVDQGKKLAKDKPPEAGRRFERAQADGELAASLAREQQNKNEAQAARDQVQKLKSTLSK